jgi:NAD(P)-dependent dehydrogenase (short-subunit alcohol dehydrogenase family)
MRALLALDRPDGPAAWRGRTALVTGGSRGLGFVAARELVAAGMRAVAICARNEVGLERARKDLARDGVCILAMRTDVTDRRQVEEMIQVVVGRFGRLDVLVNGAGAMPGRPGAALTAAHSPAAVSALFWARLHVTLTARPVMRSQGGGRIVNIGSIASEG